LRDEIRKRKYADNATSRAIGHGRHIVATAVGMIAAIAIVRMPNRLYVFIMAMANNIAGIKLSETSSPIIASANFAVSENQIFAHIDQITESMKTGSANINACVDRISNIEPNFLPSCTYPCMCAVNVAAKSASGITSTGNLIANDDVAALIVGITRIKTHVAIKQMPHTIAFLTPFSKSMKLLLHTFYGLRYENGERTGSLSQTAISARMCLKDGISTHSTRLAAPSAILDTNCRYLQNC